MKEKHLMTLCVMTSINTGRAKLKKQIFISKITHEGLLTSIRKQKKNFSKCCVE